MRCSRPGPTIMFPFVFFFRTKLKCLRSPSRMIISCSRKLNIINGNLWYFFSLLIKLYICRKVFYKFSHHNLAQKFSLHLSLRFVRNRKFSSRGRCVKSHLNSLIKTTMNAQIPKVGREERVTSVSKFEESLPFTQL